MKRWQTFLVCLLVSAVIWLIHNLSHMQTDLVSVSVIAESNIPGRASRSSDEVLISARCRASGFRLLYLGWRDKTVAVHFDPDDFRQGEGDYFRISAAQLQRYVPDIFGSFVSVEAFLSENIQFRFIRELNRKVPVSAVSLLSFRPQYMQMGDLRVTPDSVLVYGPADMLGGIEAVYTKTIIKNDIRGNLHGEVGLEVPDGMRLSSSTVSWEVAVSRFVELRAELPVEVRNAPSGVDISVFPSSVSVTFKCVFPLIADPTGIARCYIDYEDFAGSVTGRCVIGCDNLPSGVISVKLSPEVAECVENIG